MGSKETDLNLLKQGEKREANLSKKRHNTVVVVQNGRKAEFGAVVVE